MITESSGIPDTETFILNTDSPILTRSLSATEASSIKNLIFDFGGVICNIDVKRTEKRFKELGLQEFDTEYSVVERNTIFGKLEEGAITPQEFRHSIRKFFSRPLSDQQIDDAWNELLLDIPEPRIRLLESLRHNYRIFLLSNSNEIHYQKFRQDLRDKYGYSGFEELFEKAWFSYALKLKKPGRAIFDFVLKDRDLNPSETLFIDDTLQHVEGARSAGMNACLLDLKAGHNILDLFVAKQ